MTDVSPIDETQDDEVLTLATDIVAAYVSRNQINSSEVPDLIRSIHATLNDLAGGGPGAGAAAGAEAPPSPAVPIDASVSNDAVTCLDCGKAFKTLKRHIATEHGMTPVEYRARWQLSKDYPLVAPSYSKRRAATAKKIGLGRKPKKK